MAVSFGQNVGTLTEQRFVVQSNAVVFKEIQGTITARRSVTVLPTFYVKALLIFSMIATVFATLLGVYLATGIAVIHPFLSLVGALGGLTLILPVAIDIRHKVISQQR